MDDLTPDAVRPRRNEAVFAQALEIRRMLEEARERPLGEPTVDPAYAEELIREIRSGRDGD